jgi:hypothetical protein
MTRRRTYTVTVPAGTFTRRTEATYTHAAITGAGRATRATFHATRAAAERRAGRLGLVVPVVEAAR